MIINIYQTANPTPHRGWDWVCHYEGQCEDYEHRDPFGEGSTPQEALQNFLDVIGS